jgi:hypothetical protein
MTSFALRITRTFSVVAFSLTLVGNYGRGKDAKNPAPLGSPVLVELFTSEGCSSCPPADAFLQKLDALQPVRGAQLIALSEHVDYWNHDGWKDSFSSTALTQRQEAYCRVLGTKEPYTPEFVVDGKHELQMGDPRHILEALQQAAATPKIFVRLGAVSIDKADPPVVHGEVESDGDAENRKADVYVAVALNQAESQVLRGENGGRRLSHVAVVESLAKIGKFEKGKSFKKEFQLKLKPGTDAANVRVVAFVQESGPGRVIGAALGQPSTH